MSSITPVGYSSVKIDCDGHCCPGDDEDVMCPQCILRRLQVLSTMKSSRPLGKPTRALPGSKRKIEVLAERFQLGQSLWHPLDRKAKLQ